jgi:hypothetical protein
MMHATPQPTGREVHVNRIFLPSLARRALGIGSSISLSGNLHPQLTSRNSPLILREVGLRTFTNLVVKRLVSRSPKTRKQSMLDLFSLSFKFLLIANSWSRCQTTRSRDSRNPIYRNSDALARFDFQWPLFPIGTSDFVKS